MAKILCIETSASALSVCLAEDGRILADRVCTEPRQQAALTAPLVKEVLSAAGVTVKDCDAVCVSAGPGSYTGLRVGASTAKGLAFGAGIPLLAVGTLDVLVAGALGAQRIRGSGGVAPQSVEGTIVGLFPCWTPAGWKSILRCIRLMVSGLRLLRHMW